MPTALVQECKLQFALVQECKLQFALLQAETCIPTQQFPVLPNDSHFCLINEILSPMGALWDSKIRKNHVTSFLF